MTTTQPIPNLTPEQAHELAQEQARILQVGTGFDAYRFAYRVLGADIAALQARVLAVGEALDCYLFARDVQGADIAACQDRVLTVGSGVEAYYVAKEVPGADIAACQARVLAVGTAMSAYWFARGIHNANVEALYAFAQAQDFNGLNKLQQTEFDAKVAEYRIQHKEVTVLMGAFETGENGVGPDGVAVALNAELLNKIRQAMDVSKVIPNLANVCLREMPKIWLPAGLEAELIFQDPLLVVSPDGVIYFEDVPADGNFKIQSREVEFDRLRELFESSANGDVVFANSDYYDNRNISQLYSESQDFDEEDGDYGEVLSQ